MTTKIPNNDNDNDNKRIATKLVIATRLHLGNASAPPSTEKIRGWIQNLHRMAASSAPSGGGGGSGCSHRHAIMIAVDATPKIPNYDYVQAIQEEAAAFIVATAQENESGEGDGHDGRDGDAGDDSSTTPPRGARMIPIIVLPVTPWGKFVPALNALVYHAHTELQADQILMVSAEVSASPASIQALSDHCRAGASHGGGNDQQDDDDDTESYVLVAGAALNGHLYYHDSTDSEEEAHAATSARRSKTSSRTQLNGRTCPWNTLAVWNVPKLALTGFLPVSDLGGTAAGVEECAAIAVHQHLFPKARAKLVKLPDVVDWQDTFDDDEERRQWHERKMNSKLERAEAQLKMLHLFLEASDDSTSATGAGFVEHC